MAKKTFKGRPLIPGKLKGKALASKQPFNVSASYLENLFGGNTTSAPCTDVVNKELVPGKTWPARSSVFQRL